MNLFEITGQYLQILEMAENPDTSAEALETALVCIKDDFHDKADNYAYIIRQLDADAEAINKEIIRLEVRRDAAKANAQRMKEALTAAMWETGELKFKTNLNSFWLQNTTSVRLIEGAKIPPQYLTPQEPKVNKLAIAADLKHGVEMDFAELETKTGVRFR